MLYILAANKMNEALGKEQTATDLDRKTKEEETNVHRMCDKILRLARTRSNVSDDKKRQEARVTEISE